MVLGQLLRRKTASPNPKTNPNLDLNPNPKGGQFSSGREGGGNCPDTKFYLIFLVLALLGFYVVDWFTWYRIINRM